MGGEGRREEVNASRSFGEFMKNKRIEKGLTLADVAMKVGCSRVFLCDVENDRRKPPENEKLETLMDALGLSASDRVECYDLAGNARDAVSQDLKGYIMDNEAVRMALRLAKDAGMTAGEWMEIAGEIQKRKKNL